MKVVEKKQARQDGFIGRLALSVLLFLLGGFFVLYRIRKNSVHLQIEASLAFFYTLLQQHQGWLILSLFLLPTFGIPLSPLLLTAGTIWRFPMALGICSFAIGSNLVFSYFFYQRCLHRWLLKLIFHNQPLRKPKSFSRLTSLRWCFLIQLIPHLPYSAQCYILANVKEVRFWHYWSISWAVQFAWAIGFISMGKAILSKQWGFTIVGIFLILIVFTYQRFVHYRKMGRKHLE
ncbi:MAG: VTT domain-containing protein [Opitutales bacterium]|nr:VTT domain-containing protein [Opitutales bacterium]